MRPAHLERSSTVRLPDYLRWHGAAQLGTPRAKLAQIAYGLLPRDVFISVEQRAPGNLDPDEWAILRRVIDLIKTNANGAELGPVLETIENALRADQAISIAALSDLADRRRGSTGDLFAEFKANRELIEAIASVTVRPIIQCGNEGGQHFFETHSAQPFRQTPFGEAKT